MATAHRKLAAVRRADLCHAPTGSARVESPRLPLRRAVSRGRGRQCRTRRSRAARQRQSLDLRDYVDLVTQSGFPEPVLRLPASERDPWLSSYLEQLLTRDVADLSPRHDPQRLRRFVE